MSEPLEPAHIDTSVIVRYLTDDPPAMAEAAARLMESGRPLIVSELVLAETAYVLSSVYAVPRVAVVDALIAFIQRRNVRLLNLPKPLALDAFRLCRDSRRFSYADALLWAEARHSNVHTIYSFDARFPHEGLALVQPT